MNRRVEQPVAAQVLTNAELVAARRELGVSGPWLARYLDASDRTVRRWESGQTPLPQDVCEVVLELLAEARERVEQTAAAVIADPSVTYLKVPRDDGQLVELGPDVPQWGYPASWYQQVFTRAAEQVRHATGRQIRLIFFDEARPEQAGDTVVF